MTDLTHDAGAPPALQTSATPKNTVTLPPEVSAKLEQRVRWAAEKDKNQAVAAVDRAIERVTSKILASLAAPAKFALVPFGQIFPSKTNPRKTFEGPKFDELVKSIRVNGVLQPVLLRTAICTADDVARAQAAWPPSVTGPLPKVGEDALELVVGERRWRASIAAGKIEIPATIRELSDGEVRTIQIVENLQREDVSALEEAGGYKALLAAMTAGQKDKPISDHKTREEMVAEIAQQIGKSARYVWARMKLDQLIPPIKQALAEGKIEASHGDEFARLSEAQQKEVFLDLFCDCDVPSWQREEGKEYEFRLSSPDGIPSVRDLKARLKRDGHELKKAPWKLKKDTFAPACGPCEFNTANQDGGDAAKPVCINDGCYEDKKKRYFNVRIEELRAKCGHEPTKVSDSSLVKEKGVLKKSDWAKASNGSCEFLIDAIHVGYQGEMKGIVQCCVTKSCKVHFGKGGVAADSPSEIAQREKEKAVKAARAKEQSIRNRTLLAFLKTIDKLTPEITRTLTTWFASARHCDAGVQKLISEAIGKPVLDVVKKSPVDTAEFAKAVTGVFAARSLTVNDWGRVEDGRDDFHAMIDALGGSAKKLRAMVETGESVPAQKELTSEQLNNLAAPKKAAPKQFAKSTKPVKKNAAKPPTKKVAKKTIAKKGGK